MTVSAPKSYSEPAAVHSPTSVHSSEYDFLASSRTSAEDADADGDHIVWSVSSLADALPVLEHTLPENGDDFVLIGARTASASSNSSGEFDGAGSVALPRSRTFEEARAGTPWDEDVEYELHRGDGDSALDHRALHPLALALATAPANVRTRSDPLPMPTATPAAVTHTAATTKARGSASRAQSASALPTAPAQRVRRRGRARAAAGGAARPDAGVASGNAPPPLRRVMATSSTTTPHSGGAQADRGEWSYPSPASTPTPDKLEKARAQAKSQTQKAKLGPDARALTKAPCAPPASPRQKGLGARTPVDDVSEAGDVAQGAVDKHSTLLSTAYDEAVKFMNSFILHPHYYTSKASKLTFLQALIIELGLCHEHALPGSLTGARALLKAHAFLSVRDYLAVRAQGVDALRQAMYPSKPALVRALRKKRAAPRAPLGWVKETGLTVLLVRCY